MQLILLDQNYYHIEVTDNMKVKSQTDLITNSSSEIFTIKAPGKTKEEILKILQDYHKTKEPRPENYDELSWEERLKYDGCGSGMGGELSVEDFEDEYEDFKSGLPESKQHLCTPEIYSIHSGYDLETLKETFSIDIDESFMATCQFVFDNFEVLDCDSGCIRGVYDKEGLKIIRTTTWEEWSKLSPLEKYGKVTCDNYDVDTWE